MEAAYARVVALGDSAHAERAGVMEAALSAYGRAFRQGEGGAYGARADSLAGALYDRLAYSRHALGDTAGWAEASGHRLRYLYLIPDDSTRADELRRGAYAVGFGDYAEGVHRLRDAAEYALARGDTVAYVLARHCEVELVRRHGGAVVPVAQREGVDASACEPTDARLLWTLAALALGLFVLGVEAYYGRVAHRSPYLYGR